jgi:hypothetical protein
LIFFPDTLFVLFTGPFTCIRHTFKSFIGVFRIHFISSEQTVPRMYKDDLFKKIKEISTYSCSPDLQNLCFDRVEKWHMFLHILFLGKGNEPTLFWLTETEIPVYIQLCFTLSLFHSTEKLIHLSVYLILLWIGSSDFKLFQGHTGSSWYILVPFW